MSDSTYNKVKRFIEKHCMIEEDSMVAAGVSGGADSVCLLHILWRLQKDMRFRLMTVHVDHGVRPDSAEDAAYVEELCRKLEIPFYLKRVDMNGYAAENGLSSEEAGRQLRYAAFEEILAGQQPEGACSRIAVAHNCNDRAETMLFHMFRGSGIKGIASIQPVRGKVIRPLLCLERAEIEQYLTEYGLRFCQDSTNEQDTYTRNRIRHHILPYAEKEICSGAVAHMGELAEILSETERYLEAQTIQLCRLYVEEMETDTELLNAVKNSGSVSLRGNADSALTGLCIQSGKLSSEDPVMYKRVLLACLERLTPHRKDITGQHIADLSELMRKDGSREISLPYGIRACKEYDKLYLIKAEKGLKYEKNTCTDSCSVYEVVPPTEIFLPAEGSFAFTLLEKKAGFCEKEQNIPQNRYTKWFDYDKITTSLLLRTRQKGDYLTIDAAMHTKSVKQYMINEKIPKVQRDNMHLLVDGSHVLWIPGYRISQNYKVDESTRRILQVQFRGGNHGGTN